MCQSVRIGTVRNMLNSFTFAVVFGGAVQLIRILLYAMRLSIYATCLVSQYVIAWCVHARWLQPSIHTDCVRNSVVHLLTVVAW